MDSGELSRAARAEWTSLERHLQLVAGFWLGFLFAPSSVPVDAMAARTAEIVRAQRRSFVRIAPETPDELRAVLGKLLEPEALAAGCVWVQAIREDAPGVEGGPWSAAWETLILRMNERRDLYRQRLSGGLLLAAPPRMKARIREGASDLWSVRAIVVEVAAEARIEPFPLGAPVLGAAEDESGGIDTEFALAEAERRGRRGGGAAITRAAALVRAAKGLVAEGRAEAAERAAREAAKLLEGECGMERAEALATLAAAERAVSGNTAEAGVARDMGERAAGHIEEALRIGEGGEDGRLLDWYALGAEIMLGQGEPVKARSMAEKAVAVARRVGGDLVGSLIRVGDLARAEGRLGTARGSYEETVALLRARLVGKGVEDAVPVRENLSALLLKLAEVNREQGDEAAARAAYDEALSIGACKNRSRR